MKKIALLLALCICCSVLVPNAYAIEFNVLDRVNELTDTAFVLPDIVDSVEAERAEYVGRVKDSETNLNTFVFDNGDGTHTMRVYGHPVKYIDSDGSVKDITTDIQSFNGGFKTADNSIVTTFSESVTDGIILEYEEIEIKMIPVLPTASSSQLSTATATLSNDSKTVSYYYDSKTSLDYALTYMGFKEDIVVNEYTGQTEYPFIIYTGGLAPIEIGGSWYLADENGEVKANIGDVIIFTADERNNSFGTMSWQTVKENQIYAMTIHIDAEYLRAQETLYPIRIDPTIEINYTNNGVGAIEDYRINSTTPHTGTESVLRIGTHSDDYSISRALMRFPTLDIDGYSIVDASIQIRDVMCESTSMDIECRYYDGDVWSEDNSLSWSDVSSGDIGGLLDVQTISYGNGNVDVGDDVSHWYSFDITDIADDWSVGNNDPLAGVIFKATDEYENSSTTYGYRSFASYNRTSYNPYLTVTYRILFYLDEYWVAPGSTKALNVSYVFPSSYSSVSNSDFTWVSSNDEFTITSNGVITAPADGGVTNLTVTHIESGDSMIFSIVSSCFPDGSYYIQNMETGFYIDIEGPSSANGASIQENTYHGEDHSLWILTNTSDGYYTIESAYNYKYLSDSSYAIEQSNSTKKWQIVETSSGNYKIVSKDDESSDLVIASPYSTTSPGADLELSTYTNDSSDLDEWQFYAPSEYGSRAFLDLDESYYEMVNCHGYAMNLYDKPSGWLEETQPLLDNHEDQFKNGNVSDLTLSDLTSSTKTDFEQWLSDNYTDHLDWEEIDANTPIHENQYRVVLRVGGSLNVYPTLVEWNNEYYIVYVTDYDYHFWYQTNDGRWANKHGERAVELMDYGITPEDDSAPGWALGDQTGYYCSDIYYYAISIN